MSCLIIYATKYGSVGKVAQLLKVHIRDEITIVNIMKEKVPSLDNYQTVILGGSIYVGKIQKPLINFIKKNLPQLLRKRIALFICAAEQEPLLTKELTESFPPDLLQQALVKDVLGYEFNFEKLSFLHKIMVKKVMGVTTSYSKLDEEKIRQFALAITNE